MAAEITSPNVPRHGHHRPSTLEWLECRQVTGRVSERRLAASAAWYVQSLLCMLST